MQQATNLMFGVFSDLQENEQNILRYGISLFQMVYPKRLWSEKRIFGPYNLKVTETDLGEFNRGGNRPPQFHVEWMTSGNAQLTFLRNKDRKTGIAYMPDDPYWHNRMILMNQRPMLSMVTQLTLPNGNVKTAAEIELEINCLESALKEEIEIFNIVMGGRIIGTAKTKKEAEDYITDANTVQPRVTKDGHFITPKRRKREYEIYPGTATDYKQEIKELMLRERTGHTFGWSECSEFMQKIRPAVIEDIKSKRETFKTEEKTASAAEIARAMANWDATEKAEFMEHIRKSMAVATQQQQPTQDEEDEIIT